MEGPVIYLADNDLELLSLQTVKNRAPVVSRYQVRTVGKYKIKFIDWVVLNEDMQACLFTEEATAVEPLSPARRIEQGNCHTHTKCVPKASLEVEVLHSTIVYIISRIAFYT